MSRYVIIGLLAVVILALVVLLIVILRRQSQAAIAKSNHYRSNVIIDGGVDIVSGRYETNDQKYFNGAKAAFPTVNLSYELAKKSDLCNYITLKSLNGSQSYERAFVREIIIGRTSAGQNCPCIALENDASVSSKHCVISQRNGLFYISDLGSSNHTYLNGVIVVGAKTIKSGDKIRIGANTFNVKLVAACRQK